MPLPIQFYREGLIYFIAWLRERGLAVDEHSVYDGHPTVESERQCAI